MSEPVDREVVVLNTALELPPEERPAFLEDACAGNAALRRKVEDLIRAHEEAGQFMTQAPQEYSLLRKPTLRAEKIGDKIGHYKLLEQIGEGGCGVVYMAEQEEPVKRRVALKVIKLGMDTKQVTARFEAERQALALMDHPNIARVLDAGATETGRPYFVMELVRGIKITEFCDENNVTTEERLQLFIQVCQAVQHAHQKGIIHRDLKPSNILVTVNDGVPVPKVIDFGIAKATQGRLTDQTLFTAFEQFLGTPAYMSPEQAVMTSLDIDTRSDIYSLGVLLYELLTGSTPFDQKELLAAGLDEMRRTIREREPLKPSTRLSTMLDAERTTIARHRQTDAFKLIHRVRGDLDWIAMKCLEKDRARRYETANGLAADLQRHLADEPIVARPPSRWYEFQKTVRRHKFGFAATTAIIIVLAAGVVASTWQAVRATKATHEAQTARQEAEANEQKAQTEAIRSAEVAQLMKDMLKGVGPSVALGQNTTLLHGILDQTARRLDELKNQPEVEADLRVTLGSIYRDLGDYSKAETMLEQALALRKKLSGEKSLQVAAVLDLLGQTLHRAGKPGEAETDYRKSLAIREELSGHESLDVASSLNHLGSLLRNENQRDEAEVKLREGLVLRRRLLPPDSPGIANSLGDLGLVLAAEGKAAESEPLLREALALRKKILPADDPQIADALMKLAGTLTYLTNYPEAETNYMAALAIQQKVLGDHPDTANTLDSLGSLLVTENRLTEAEQRFREALAMRNKVFGESAVTSDRLIDVLQKQGKKAEVENLCHDQLARWNRVSNENRPPLKLANSLIASGKALFAAGKPDEGEAAYRQALEIQRSYSVADGGIALLESLCRHLDDAGRLDQADTLFREAFDLEKKLHGSANTNVVRMASSLSYLLEREGKLAEAETFGREALAVAKELGIHDSLMDRVLYLLGWYLNRQGKNAEAEALWREGIANNQANSDFVISMNVELSKLLRSEGKSAEANALLRAVDRSGKPGALNSVAWSLATSPEPEMRDGSNAVFYAEKAVTLTSRTNAMILDTLAAAYAELGQFDKAVAVQREVIGLLGEQKAKAGSYVERLSLYQSSIPCRESDPASVEDKAAELFRTGKFKETVPWFVEICDQNPGNSKPFMQLAALLMETGDTNGYRLRCHDALGRFANTEGMIACRVARASLLSPLDPQDTAIAVQLAELALAQTTDPPLLNEAWLGKGMAEYRLGKFADAVVSLAKVPLASKNNSRADAAINAAAFAVMASAQQQLTQPEKARASLAQAENALNVVRGSEPGGNWHDILSAQVLLREARGLSESDKTAK